MTGPNPETFPCGIVAFRDDGMVEWINMTLAEWLGYQPEEVAGKNVEILLTLPSRIFYQTHLFPILAMHGSATEIFLTLRKKDGGHIPTLLSGKKELIEGHAIYTCACITVYHRKQFEDELLAARNKAEVALRDNTSLKDVSQKLKEQSERLDEQLTIARRHNSQLTQLSRVVSHELQEPIRKLSLYSQMMHEARPESEDSGAVSEKVVRAVDQMRSVISALQQFVWLQEVPVIASVIDWAKLFATVVDRLRKRYGNDSIEIICEELPSIEGDPKLLDLLAEHILQNSIQFRQPGKPAHVVITGISVIQNRYRTLPDSFRFDKFFKLEFADRGIGFNAEYKEQIFDLLNRMHERSRGGAGLALCKLIVEKHDGNIQIGANPGGGTVVTVSLPMSARSVAGAGD